MCNPMSQISWRAWLVYSSGVYGLFLGGPVSSAHVLSVHQIRIPFTLTTYDASSSTLPLMSLSASITMVPIESPVIGVGIRAAFSFSSNGSIWPFGGRGVQEYRCGLLTTYVWPCEDAVAKRLASSASSSASRWYVVRGHIWPTLEYLPRSHVTGFSALQKHWMLEMELLILPTFPLLESWAQGSVLS